MFSWLKMAVHNHLLGLNSSWRHIHHLLIKQNQSYKSIINLDLATLHFGIFDELRLIQDTSWRLHYNITWTVCLSVPWIYYEHVFQDMIWLCLFQRPCLPQWARMRSICLEIVFCSKMHRNTLWLLYFGIFFSFLTVFDAFNFFYFRSILLL